MKFVLLTIGSMVVVATSQAATTKKTAQHFAETSPGLFFDQNLSQFRDYGFSSQEDMESYYKFENVEINEVERQEWNSQIDEPGNTHQTSRFDGVFKPQDIFGLLLNSKTFDHWVVLGEKTWAIIKESKIADIKDKTISVLPANPETWNQMTNWRGPSSKTYRVSARNAYGITVISFDYTVVFHHSGKLESPAVYIAHAAIEPANLHVLWLFDLEADVHVGDPFNVGSQEKPVTAIDLQFTWKMTSLLTLLQGTSSFCLRGDGKYSAITVR